MRLHGSLSLISNVSYLVSRTNINIFKGIHVFTSKNAVRGISKFSPLRQTLYKEKISKDQAVELTLRLTSEERKILFSALQEFESKKIKDEYEGQLAATRWRSKFGRPSKLPVLGDVDPTGSYCPMPEDWLQKKYAETVPEPSSAELLKLAVANSIPFIGFGFLDNFIMIVAGDQIELIVGTHICLSTMAAAALGNTFSDVVGIGSAYYVERAALYVGFTPPKLNPIQLDMATSHRWANAGRVIGITIGCILGMVPLLFISQEKKDETKEHVITPTVQEVQVL